MTWTPMTPNEVNYVDSEILGEIGVAHRTPAPGPELELVGDFLTRCPISAPDEYRITLFLEPRTPSGYPDLLFVLWDPRITQRALSKGTNSEAKLTRADFQMLHLLSQLSAPTDETLQQQFLRPINPHLRRLEMAGLVQRDAERWSTTPVTEYLAVKNILACEAKISDWKTLLHQSSRNSWFADQSLAIAPKTPSGVFVERAEKMKVGLWTQDSTDRLELSATDNVAPKSYFTWVINEWLTNLVRIGAAE